MFRLPLIFLSINKNSSGKKLTYTSHKAIKLIFFQTVRKLSICIEMRCVSTGRPNNEGLDNLHLPHCTDFNWLIKCHCLGEHALNYWIEYLHYCMSIPALSSPAIQTWHCEFPLLKPKCHLTAALTQTESFFLKNFRKKKSVGLDIWLRRFWHQWLWMCLYNWLSDKNWKQTAHILQAYHNTFNLGDR